MERTIEQEIQKLDEEITESINPITLLKAQKEKQPLAYYLPKHIEERFFKLIDKLTLSMMEDEDYFYSYFLFQVQREICFDLASPTGFDFKLAKYRLCFNPVIFLKLNKNQMISSMKHEILHIVSMHPLRARALRFKYSTLAINIAMDLVVNRYLNHLPPYAITVEQINAKYQLKLNPFETFEYYVEAIQTQIDLEEIDEECEEEVEDESDPSKEELSQQEVLAQHYDVHKTHELWEHLDIDEQVLQQMTENLISQSQKGTLPTYLESLILELKEMKEELPWEIYLNKVMGSIQNGYKKVTTRRSRRQPERLDLRGTLRKYQPQIGVAIDISGSISDEAYEQAMKEVLAIIRRYKGKMTVIECDDVIRRDYVITKENEVMQRISAKGATKFTPVFEYANRKQFDLLIYFTDGQGEEELSIIPKGYKVLWVLSGKEESLSLKNGYGAIRKLTKVKAVDKILDLQDIRLDGFSMTHQESTF